MKDVDKAVRAAKEAFEFGEWGKMNARERGNLMYRYTVGYTWLPFDDIDPRLSELMEQHKEELATLESLDSGAVYTLALKTHVGMSIDTFRYFAGWCDKIQVGSSISFTNVRSAHLSQFFILEMSLHVLQSSYFMLTGKWSLVLLYRNCFQYDAHLHKILSTHLTSPGCKIIGK